MGRVLEPALTVRENRVPPGDLAELDRKDPRITTVHSTTPVLKFCKRQRPKTSKATFASSDRFIDIPVSVSYTHLTLPTTPYV